MRPFLLFQIVVAVQADEGDVSTAYALLLIVSFGVVIFVESLVQNNVRQFLSSEAGTAALGATVAILNRKALKIKRAETTSEVGLIGNDCIKCYESWKWGCLIFLSITGLLGGIVILVVLLREAAIVGLVTMFVVVAINIRISRLTKHFEEARVKKTDTRLFLLGEVIRGAKAVKLLAWEESYLDCLHVARKEETLSIVKHRLFESSSISLGRGSPILACSASFVYIGLTGGDLDTATVFSSLAAFQALRLPMIIIPFCLITISNITVSMKRITEFLLLPERVPIPMISAKKQAETAVLVEDGNFEWPHIGAERIPQTVGNVHKSFTLRSINLNVPKGGMVAIVGPVGAGKSSLLSALLGDMDHLSGQLSRVDKIGFSPQKAFVISGTIQENVVMGRPFSQLEFDRAAQQACLVSDLANMPKGVETEVGERGVTLSGGQQQRLAIARALYGQPSLLVLDDPLAAVDPAVANSIFNDGILQKAKDCSVLMALNQLWLLPSFDHIVYLQDGEIVEQGSYQQLLLKGGAFSTLIRTYEDESSHTQQNEDKTSSEPSSTTVCCPTIFASMLEFANFTPPLPPPSSSSSSFLLSLS
jgi:ABC-type multidrug transport system fused ATPase/permease subunit